MRTVCRKISLCAASPTFLVIGLLTGCATTPKTEFQMIDGASECVVLLHGFNQSWRSMRPMANGLFEYGYMTANVDYPSRSGRVSELVPLAVATGVEQCREAGATRIHFVTHSIGGILLRYAQAEEPIPELGRVVMLAPPSSGSELVDKTRNIPGAELIAGEALMQLGTDEDSVPASLGPIDFELGIIAGSANLNPLTSAMLPGADDGRVSVERTKAAGMSDFMIVDDNHRHIVEEDIVIRNTAEFLRTGAFIGD